MDIHNLVFGNGPIRIRELNQRDCGPIKKIAGDYSENATFRLYKAYCTGYIQDTGGLKDEVLATLERLDRSLKLRGRPIEQIENALRDSEVKQRLIDAIHRCDERGLFSPYGPIYAPFNVSVPAYINKAIYTRQKAEREFFRLGIEYSGQLTGCIAFDIIEKIIQGCRTIGDIGVFMKNTNARNCLGNVLCMVLRFIDRDLGYKDKNANLYIGATTHLCNQETPRLLGRLGFNEKNNIIDPDYGPRRLFTAEYCGIVKKVSFYEKGHGLAPKES
ncbi:MAG: hypothetical protein LBK83_09490 [Treponema sp.]|jgi:hypothetical protein|nr:hypothetical protein [Treponema sp.]